MTKTDKTTTQTDLAKENKTPPSNPAGKSMIKALHVRAANGPFRRAGITFCKEAIVIPLDNLSEEQITMIKSEPMLAVSEIEIEMQPASDVQ